jgi:hypothetical protein
VILQQLAMLAANPPPHPDPSMYGGNLASGFGSNTHGAVYGGGQPFGAAMYPHPGSAGHGHGAAGPDGSPLRRQMAMLEMNQQRMQHDFLASISALSSNNGG